MRSPLASTRARRATLISMSVLVLASVVAAAPVSAATHFGEGGGEVGQMLEPTGVAVDATGEVYVADLENNRVEKFDASGIPLLGWGSGVLDGTGEMQTCTTECLPGRQSGSAESFALPSGVAVDNDPLSSSYGDVYVIDELKARVEKFGPEGKFILMFGGNVNQGSSPVNRDVCDAGENCAGAAAAGTEDGEFSYMPGEFNFTTGHPKWGYNNFIAVGPGGAVYVGDKARVEVFEPSGAWRENISLAGLSSEERPTALAVDGAGDVFLKDAEVAGVHELEPNGTEKSTRFDELSTSVTGLAVDPSSGDVYVGDSSGGFHILRYDSAGKELASFGANTLSGANNGIAFSSTTKQVYAPDQGADIVWMLTPPPPGPVVDSESAAPEIHGAATLEARVNPEGSETTVHFEYVDEAHFKESGYASAASTAALAVGAAGSFESQLVSAHPTLLPGTTYHYRVVATSSQGTTTGEDQSFQEIPPALIGGPWVSDVAGTSVTIGVRIDPLGANTSYRIEITSGSHKRVFSGSVGQGMSYVTIMRHVQELEPVTTYHVRVVTSNGFGTWQSADRPFTTQAAVSELMLPDGRQWELVSPANKQATIIEPAEGSEGLVQAAGDGHGITYVISMPITEKATVSTLTDQVISVRGSRGWRSQEYGASGTLSEQENLYAPDQVLGFTLTQLFSADLTQAVVEPSSGQNLAPLAPEAPAQTLYSYDTATARYLPLVTPANVPPGTEFGPGRNFGKNAIRFAGATPDLGHVVFQSPMALTENAVEGVCRESEGEPLCGLNLYEWNAGRISLVNVLPDGKPLVPETYGGDAWLGRSPKDVIHAISDDGRRIVWQEGNMDQTLGKDTLYERDMVEGTTKQLGGVKARFETASGDGSRVFYWEHSELYAFDFATGTSTDVTANHGPGEYRAGVIDGAIMAAGEDGRSVYYMARGVLALGAVSGEENLYVSHNDGSAWTTTLVATLAPADQFNEVYAGTVNWTNIDARVSPNGRYLAFMSSRALTGYDNIDAVSEQPDEEVYLYDAASNHLVCASCNPSGARPIGISVSSYGPGPLVDRLKHWKGHSIAANIPLWHDDRFYIPGADNAIYQPRYLSDSGRLFFDSSDPLVPQDTNGLMDVYQYEPSGVGGCKATSATFSERSGGCVDLISSGTSSAESAFMDASESGNDVFFVTGEKLVGEDYDTAPDIYDAHVCTTAAPCHAASVSPPPCASGDACKGSPTPQPELFGANASETFSGAGNVTIPKAQRPLAKQRQRRCGMGSVRKHGRCVSRKRQKPHRRVHKSVTGKAMRRGK